MEAESRSQRGARQNVSGIPKEIPNLGSVAQTPRQNPRFSPGAEFSTEDYFVWTRCDGATSVKDIILMVGLGYERSAAILDKLRRAGAILFDGETPESVEPAAEANGPIAAGELIGDPDLTEEERAALAEDVGLSDAEKRRILAMRRRVLRGSYFEILGVGQGAEKREIKRAYFRISKEFHPDRHYGQDLGSFGPWLSAIFEKATKAFETLGDRRAREAYEARLRGEPAEGRSKPQTKAEHAAELFDRACDLEVRGEAEQAVPLFAAACRLVAKPRYLRRAALCAKSAGKLSEAEEYAKKAADLRPDDPSHLRVLADVHRAAGRLEEAEEILLRALEIKTESDTLLAGLQSDLDAVRRDLGRE